MLLKLICGAKNNRDLSFFTDILIKAMAQLSIFKHLAFSEKIKDSYKKLPKK